MGTTIERPSESVRTVVRASMRFTGSSPIEVPVTRNQNFKYPVFRKQGVMLARGILASLEKGI